MVLSAAVVLAMGTILFTLFVRSQDVPEAPPVSPTAHLEERKAQIYENLRDLQFEYRLDKLSDADYQATKLELQKDLAQVMAETDRIKAELGMPASVPAPPKPVVPQQVTKRNVCPHCNASFDRALKFCGECGKPMGGAA